MSKEISKPFDDKTCILLSNTSCCFTLYMYTLFQGITILRPSPKGGSSVTTPFPNVLNKTPASPYPIFTNVFARKMNNKRPPTKIGSPSFCSFSMINLIIKLIDHHQH